MARHQFKHHSNYNKYFNDLKNIMIPVTTSYYHEIRILNPKENLKQRYLM